MNKEGIYRCFIDEKYKGNIDLEACSKERKRLRIVHKLLRLLTVIVFNANGWKENILPIY